MKKLVIVIDDDEDDCEFIRQSIGGLNLNHDVMWFGDGQAAFDFLLTADTLPYLILSDINMPVLDGMGLRKKIFDSNNLELQNVPFVFFTTTAQQKAVKLAFKLEANGFFEKPLLHEDYVLLFSQIVNYWYKSATPIKSF